MKRIVGLMLLWLFSGGYIWGYSETFVHNGMAYTYKSNIRDWWVISYYLSGHEICEVRYSGEITIPDSIQYYAEIVPIVGIDIYSPHHFKDVTKLTVPNTLRYIYGIAGCQIETIDLPDSLQSMINFNTCPNLKEVIIPSLVPRIGDYNLANCPQLTHVHIGEKVSYISPKAFMGSTALTSITIDENNRYFSVEDGVLFNKDKTKLIFCPKGKTGKYVVPDGVVEIESYAFQQSQLTEIVFPESVEKMGDLGVFMDSPNLERIVWPRNCKSIQGFKGCISLKEVVMEEVEEISANAFEGCVGLTQLVFPSSLKSIKQSAYKNCTGLQDVTLPEGLEVVGDSLFWGCSGLQNVTLPNDISVIEEAMFGGCTSLKRIDIPSSVITIEYYAFHQSGLETLTIPTSVESVGSFYCTSLKEWVIQDSNLPLEIKDLWWQNSYLEREEEFLYIGRVLDTWGYTFNVRALKEMKIGSYVEDISNLNFNYAIYLDTITCVGLTPSKAVATQFPEAAYEYCTLYVPASSEETYRTTAPWSQFKHIEPFSEVSPSAIELNLNSRAFSTYYAETEQLIANVIPANTSFSTITWDSSNKRVATVSSTGVITPVGDGEADIIASVNNGSVSDTCHVMVLYSGIEETTTEAIMIYPNPVDDVLYVRGAKEGEVVTLYNLAGRMVCTATVTSGETVIDTVDLPSGIYFCRVADRTVKVVKR